jgi:hypothetical protein
MRHLRRLRRDERGFSLVFIAGSFMAFMAAATLAIDVGMFMTARAQAQNAADSGALAGAVALAFNSFTDRSATGPAVVGAIDSAHQNLVMRGQVSVLPSDVSFPTDPSGYADRVRVNVFRTSERGNAVPTLLGSLLGLRTVDIGATATAEASPAGAETCVKPFTIPDRWIEMQDAGGWTINSTFDYYNKDGSVMSNHDVYNPPGTDDYTGYNATRDRGTEIILKASNSEKIAPSMYNPYDIPAHDGLPASTGGNDYRDNIASCNTWTADLTQGPLFVPPENGNMIGPTKDGMDLLTAQDPTAYWNDSPSVNCAVRPSDPTACVTSPRIAIIPVYDPNVYAAGQQSGKNAQLQVVNFIGFFIEEQNSNGDVRGRITPVGGIVTGGGSGTVPKGVFPVAIRLVK